MQENHDPHLIKNRAPPNLFSISGPHEVGGSIFLLFVLQKQVYALCLLKKVFAHSIYNKKYIYIFVFCL